MKPSLKKYIVGLALLLTAYAPVFGQAQPFPLGKATSLLQEFRQQANIRQQQLVSGAQLRINATTTLTAKVNFRQTGGTEEFLTGEIINTPGSSFFIRISGQSVEGNILFKQSQKAYSYYTDATGNAYVKEVNINEVICVNYEEAPGAQPAAFVSAAAAVPVLQSYASGKGCVLLDFDGQYVSGTLWNNGNPIDAKPSAFTEAQIREIWEMVSEDFKPFHINITTSETVFNTYAKTKRMRVILTPTKTAAPSAGGVAYIGSFKWDDNTPCWVFNAGVKAAGEAASHEVGHTFGLGHDGRTSPAEGYYAGHGDWAPIMGVSYYEPITQWSKGEYTNASQKEDDLAKIASATYGVGYRKDIHGNTVATAAALAVDTTGKVTTTGIIDHTNDIDVFSFKTTGGAATLNCKPVARHANLDILATLYNSSGAVLATSNPSGLAAATISGTLKAGTYYVSVKGTGAGAPASSGYSSYASLGAFSITGTINKKGTEVVTVYQHCDHGGYAVGLAPGTYTLAQLKALGVADNDLSSLKVMSGYEVVLYENDNFSGNAYVFRRDFSCLANLLLNDLPLNLSDWTTSLLVRASTASAAPGMRLSETGEPVISEVAAPTTGSMATTKITGEKDIEVVVSPNPFTSQLSIKVQHAPDQYYVRIYSMTGTEVRQPQRISNGQPINLSNLPTGMYLVKMYIGDKVITRKVIKH